MQRGQFVTVATSGDYGKPRPALEHDRFKLKRESCSKTLMRDRFTFEVDRESDPTSNDRARA
jgi:hypothetical protein